MNDTALDPKVFRVLVISTAIRPASTPISDGAGAYEVCANNQAAAESLALARAVEEADDQFKDEKRIAHTEKELSQEDLLKLIDHYIKLYPSARSQANIVANPAP